MAGINITGIGWVTAAGMGCGRDYETFAMPWGPLPDINPSDMFKKPYPNFRRMDKYSRLGLTAIAIALIDAGLSEWTRERNIGIIASTVYGCLETDVDYYKTVIPDRGANASPALFSYTLANSYLGEAAIRFGLTGINYVLTEQQFWDQDNILVKSMKALEIKELGGRTVASIIRMSEQDEPEEWTQMSVQDIKFDQDHPDSLFTLSSLRNPRQ